MYNCNAATCVDMYQAALTRRGTPKHACLQIVLMPLHFGVVEHSCRAE